MACGSSSASWPHFRTGSPELGKGQKIAAEVADTLTAAMVNDPLFGGEGTPIDPGVLLTPPAGKRARVSVISFVGLHSDEQRQGFVNQLQMALFAWIKRNPAGERPLGGLLVMDEAQSFAPSSATTACTASTLALVSQARKYGLGLVFATQAPRGLHNHIPGNAATQFFGSAQQPHPDRRREGNGTGQGRLRAGHQPADRGPVLRGIRRRRIYEARDAVVPVPPPDGAPDPGRGDHPGRPLGRMEGRCFDLSPAISGACHNQLRSTAVGNDGAPAAGWWPA